MSQIAKSYQSGELQGWGETVQPGLAKSAFDMLSDTFVSPSIIRSGNVVQGRKQFLWNYTRQVLGKDTENYPQQVGDCFVAGTMVLMADGTEKAIEDFSFHEIESYLVMNHLNQPRRVIDIINKKFSGTLISIHIEGLDYPLEATATHKALRICEFNDFHEGYFGEYSVGDKVLLDPRHKDVQIPVGETSLGTPMFIKLGGLVDKQGELVGVTSEITKVERREVVDYPVYCITVEGEHTLVANGVAQFNCVSFAAKNATEYVTCTQIASVAAAEPDLGARKQIIKNGRIRFRPVFPPYYYGTGRVYIGNGSLGNGDGSIGSWMAAAVEKYGTLFSDGNGVPRYSGSLARQWGDRNPRSDLDNFLAQADEFDVQSAARVRSWQELVDGVANGYPATTASSYGFDMEPGRDGFHRQRGSWSHAMCIIGVDDEWPEPYAIILNSWGNVHGELFDLYTGEKLPYGCLRVKRSVIESMIRNGELFLYSNFVGFPERQLKLEDFMML